jgi:hypothetical protein
MIWSRGIAQYVGIQCDSKMFIDIECLILF